MGSGVSHFFIFFACSCESFPLIGLRCPASLQGLLPCHIASCFALFGCQLLEAALSEHDTEKECSLGEGLLWRAWRNKGRGKCGWDVYMFGWAVFSLNVLNVFLNIFFEPQCTQ